MIYLLFEDYLDDVIVTICLETPLNAYQNVRKTSVTELEEVAFERQAIKQELPSRSLFDVNIPVEAFGMQLKIFHGF